jgi:phenylpropionate dioxygenase-like ring-hydroxylating dioxygenase large terminal subunit
MNELSNIAKVGGEQPVVIPVEAYISEDYAKAEGEKIWAKAWQIACRVEEIPKVGDYVTYDIMDESIIVVRNAPDKIVAYFNVCQHRGRRLTEGCGQAAQFRCRFHGWSWDLNGKNTFVLDPQDWGNCLTAENLALKTVKVDTWGGWVWVNMDPNCMPLKEYLGPAYTLLSPLELDKMRYSMRQWLIFPCNWKIALEAFNESYHVDASHPQLTRFGSNSWRTVGQGHCAWNLLGEPRGGQQKGGAQGMGAIMAAAGQDPRLAAYEQQFEQLRDVWGTTTQTLVNAAKRLADDLPAGTPMEKVGEHFLASAVAEDKARGVDWPQLDPSYMAVAGFDWHIFPNAVILPGPTFALCYRSRPNGNDPNSCIFEVYALERFPEGKEPKTEWVYEPEATEEKWRLILSQDFGNMGQVQKGMKSRGFKGPRPSPVQEVTVIHFHRTLAKYMGTGAPKPLK